MLESFEIVNFKSILDLKIDLKYGETTAPRHYQDSESWAFLETRNGKKGRFVSTLAIYGANASGKSNIINAFLIFQRLLTKGVIGCFAPNKLNPKYDYGRFVGEVSLDESRYRYDIKYDDKHIIQETVSLLGAGKNA